MRVRVPPSAQRINVEVEFVRSVDRTPSRMTRRVPPSASRIMFRPEVTVQTLNERRAGTLLEHLGIEFIEIGEDYLTAKMPVDKRTFQPNKILHGGAAVALAESLGSMASSSVIDRDKQSCVGIEVNANHIRMVTSGHVLGRAQALHIGKRTHVWDIRITDDFDRLINISRLTVAILDK